MDGVGGNPACLIQVSGKALAFEILHDHVGRAIGLENAMHPAFSGITALLLPANEHSLERASARFPALKDEAAAIWGKGAAEIGEQDLAAIVPFLRLTLKAWVASNTLQMHHGQGRFFA